MKKRGAPPKIVRAAGRAWLADEPSWRGWFVWSATEELVERTVSRPGVRRCAALLAGGARGGVELVRDGRRSEVWHAGSLVGTVETVGPCPDLKRWTVRDLEGGGLGLFCGASKVPRAWSGTGRVWRLNGMTSVHAPTVEGILHELGVEIVHQGTDPRTYLCARRKDVESLKKQRQELEQRMLSLPDREWVKHLGAAHQAARGAS